MHAAETHIVESMLKRAAAKGAVEKGDEEDFGSTRQVFGETNDDEADGKMPRPLPWYATAVAEGAAGDRVRRPMWSELNDESSDGEDWNDDDDDEGERESVAG